MLCDGAKEPTITTITPDKFGGLQRDTVTLHQMLQIPISRTFAGHRTSAACAKTGATGETHQHLQHFIFIGLLLGNISRMADQNHPLFLTAVLFRETHEAYSLGTPPAASACLGADLRPPKPSMAQLLLTPRSAFALDLVRLLTSAAPSFELLDRLKEEHENPGSGNDP